MDMFTRNNLGARSSLVVFLSCVFLLAACSWNSPRHVAKAYLDAVNEQDYEEAKKYATDDTRKLLNMFSSLAAITPDSLKRGFDFEISDERVTGDTAWVGYTMANSNRRQELKLIRIEGRWKVAATKDVMNEIEGGEGMDSGATNLDTTGVEETDPDTL
jgi:hypothetical protein